VISTKDLSGLPSIPKLKCLTKSLAVLDAIVEAEWQYRYYSFNSKWAVKEQMASMRDGCGNEWFCVFSESGAFLKGFDHESPMSPWAVDPERIWPGILDQLPQQFRPFANEPAFSPEATTFCVWRSPSDDTWHSGKIEFPPGHEDPDGSVDLLSMLEGVPQQYQSWAESYYGREIRLELVEHIYRHRELTEQVIRGLNVTRDVQELASELVEIGYPEQSCDNCW
jgi:hypothetical protein